MAIGDLVMVKTFLNQPIKRRICGVDDNSVAICTNESWEHGQFTETKVPREQVFKWDQALFEEMIRFDEQLDDEPQQLVQLWKRAVPY